MQQVGKYQLVRQLAVGGMAEVFLARTAGPGGFEKQLVLKRILPHLAGEPAFVQMFLSEATLAARLTHPNIAQIFDFGESDGSYYLAMEYIDGPSLRTLLDGAIRMGTPLPPVACARIIAAACEGLAFAHDFRDPATGQPLGIVHRDISPDNILLSRQGAVKVVDFGIAKAAGQRHKTQTGMIKGKLAYMPPEQIRNLPLDRRVDVYALGIVFYELVTGQRPFDAPTDVNLMHSILYEPPMPAVLRQPDLPEPVQRIIQRAIAKDRDQRYPDCVAFQADLEEYILSTGRPVTTQHIAQLIAQVAPPAYNSPLPPLPPGSPPLTDTALRAAPSQDALPPVSPPIEDTELRTAPSLGPLTGMPLRPGSSQDASLPGVDFSPSFVAEKRELDLALAQPQEVPPPTPPPQAPLSDPRPRAGSAPSAADPVTASRGKGMLRAALAGVVLLAAGGGYLLWGKSGSTPSVITAPTSPSEVPTPTVAEPPPPAAAPVTTGSTGDTPSPPEPASPPPGTASGEASARPSAEETQVDPNAPGIIEFEVTPWAIVYLEGERLGKAPPLGVLDIPPGTYTVRFENKKLGKNVERPVTVKPGQTTFVQVDFSQQEEAQQP